MRLTLTALLLVLCAGLACTDNDSRPDGGETDTDTDTDSDTDTDTDTDTDSDSDGDECSEEAKLVYVVDTQYKLFRFDPPAKTFEYVGTMECDSGGTPFSMAVGRNDKAYVLYWASYNCLGINQVNIHNAECETLVPFECGQYDFDTFGMGFATDGPDTTDETLYVGKSNFVSSGSQLAAIDTNLWELSPIAPISESPELTGNQNGELWAFFAWAPTPKVAQINKQTGEESNAYYITEFPSVAAAFAFAYWGGDFYLFHAPGEETTTVWRLHNDSLEVWIPSEATAFSIVGAGVSTCAPTIIE